MKTLVQENAYPVLSADSGEAALVAGQAQSDQINQELEQAQAIAQALNGMQSFIMQSGDQGLSVVDTEAIQVATESLCALMGLDYTKELSFECASNPLRNKHLAKETLVLAQEGVGEKFIAVVRRALDWLIAFWHKLADRAAVVSKKAAAVMSYMSRAPKKPITAEKELVQLAPTYQAMLLQGGQYPGTVQTVSDLHRFMQDEVKIYKRLSQMGQGLIQSFEKMLKQTEEVNVTQEVAHLGALIRLYPEKNGVARKLANDGDSFSSAESLQLRVYTEKLTFGHAVVDHIYVDDPKEMDPKILGRLGMNLITLDDGSVSEEPVEKIEAVDLPPLMIEIQKSAASLQVDTALLAAAQKMTRMTLGVQSEYHRERVMISLQVVLHFFTKGVSDRRTYVLRVLEAAAALGIASVKQGA